MQKCPCRVTEVDAKKKRVLLSLKKGILTAKTPAITHPAAATPGTRTHGWVTGITEIGVFIGLYSRLKGLVPIKDIDLSSGSSPKDFYHVGQVVKCTIVRGDSGKGLILSLAGPAEAAAAAEAAVSADRAALGGLEPGSVVQGAVVTAIRCAGDEKLEHGGKRDSDRAGERAGQDSDPENGSLPVLLYLLSVLMTRSSLSCSMDCKGLCCSARAIHDQQCFVQLCRSRYSECCHCPIAVIRSCTMLYCIFPVEQVRTVIRMMSDATKVGLPCRRRG